MTAAQCDPGKHQSLPSADTCKFPNREKVQDVLTYPRALWITNKVLGWAEWDAGRGELD